MAMDITLLLHITFISLCLDISWCIDTYTCSWPMNEVVQLRCDYINCPYLSVDHITVGRLHGNPSSCTELNSNNTLRKPIPSCNYQLMESHDFFGQVRNNCSRKQVCEVSTDEVFRSAGICGREVEQLDSIRNWVHIQHSCYGDIPGVRCKLPTTTSAVTRISSTAILRDKLPSRPTTSNGILTRVRRPMTRRPSSEVPPSQPVHSNGVAFVIPILATLLFCTLALIVATMLYRHGVCQQKSWKQRIEMRLNGRSHPHHGRHHQRSGSNKSAQFKVDDQQYKIDSSKLKEFEKRLNKLPVTKALSNEYFHDFSFPNTNRSGPKDVSDEGKLRTTSRKNRRGSLDLHSPLGILPTPPTAEMYFSDTSESTITEHEFDAHGRRKRRRVKPLPPLPRPIVSHSEVYFTETETESEAPTRASRRKEVLPKLDPPPKVMRDRSRHDRPRLHNRPGSIEVDAGLHHRQSLELALTKGAAKRLNISTPQEHKTKSAAKKPMARPRSGVGRAQTSLYGNIPMSNTITLGDTQTYNINRA